MKALSIRQPWCHAIVHLGKRVENRDWPWCSYRGQVLLHASKTLVLREFDEAVDSIIDIINPKPGDERLKLLRPFAFMAVPLTGKHHGEGTWRPAPTLPLGGIVGRAQIVGAGRSPSLTPGLRSPWHAGGFGLVLADVEPLPFIPWRGSLGFFEVPDGVVHKALLDATREAEKLPVDHPERVKLAQMLGAW